MQPVPRRPRTIVRTGLAGLAAIAIALATPACSKPPRTPTPPASRLDPYERALLGDADRADAPLPVVQNDDPAGDASLRRTCRAMPTDDPLLAQLASRMLATVKAQQGVGIAAPQVGIDRRVILVQRLDRPDEPFETYVNPEIVRRSPSTVVDWEGCLSIPAGLGKVRRAKSIVVAYDDRTRESGRREEKVDDFVARIFQHEIDHLDGVLFIDRKEPGDLIHRTMLERLRREENRLRSSTGSKPPPADKAK